MFPEAPPFGVLRLASHHDVPRIGDVAAAGFYFSEVFQFERPYHEQYPQDTVASYRDRFERLIRDPGCVVLVAEEPRQSGSGTSATRQDEQGDGNEAPNAAQKEDLRRDQNPERVRRVAQAHRKAVDQYFADHSLLDMVVVHPDYWRRGHGSALVKWGMRLAEMDQVRQGVLSTVMGAKLVLSLGFHKITNIHIEGDAEAPEGLSLALARYGHAQDEATFS